VTESPLWRKEMREANFDDTVNEAIAVVSSACRQSDNDSRFDSSESNLKEHETTVYFILTMRREAKLFSSKKSKLRVIFLISLLFYIVPL
jgi:hypothetical protein